MIDQKHDFERRIEANGINLKNVPNTTVEDGVFHLGDYVAKNPSSWMMVPATPDDVNVEETADHVFKPYDRLCEDYQEISVERSEDEMYWCDIGVQIPDDSSRAEQLAVAVATAITARQRR